VHTQRLALGRGRYGQLTSSSSSLRANEEGSLAAPLSFVVILWYLPVHAAIMACLRCSCLRPTHHALSRSAPHTKCVVQLCGCCEVWCVRLPFVLKGGGAHRRAVAKPRARRFGCERVVMHCGVWCVGVWAVTATDTQSRKLPWEISISTQANSLSGSLNVKCLSKKFALKRPYEVVDHTVLPTSNCTFHTAFCEIFTWLLLLRSRCYSGLVTRC
jgi:hypothetical protein